MMGEELKKNIIYTGEGKKRELERDGRRGEIGKGTRESVERIRMKNKNKSNNNILIDPT